MLDITGYLTSPSFLSELAALITAIISAFAGTFLSGFFTGTTTAG